MSFLRGTLSSILCVLLGVVLGAAAVIYRVFVRETSKQKKYEQGRHEFYANIVVTNKDQVMDSAVESKRKESVKKHKINLDPMNFGVFATEQMAHGIVKDDKFMLELATQVALGMKDKFSPQKIDATGEVCFVKGLYAVIKVKILKIDPLFLISQNVDKEKMNTLEKVFHALGYWLGEDSIKLDIRAKLTQVVVDQSVKTLGEGMMNLLKDQQGVEASVVVKSSEDQSHFFYELVKPGQKHDKVTSDKLYSVDKGDTIDTKQDNVGSKKTQ